MNDSQETNNIQVEPKDQSKKTETSWKALAFIAAFVLVFAVLIANLIVSV